MSTFIDGQSRKNWKFHKDANENRQKEETKNIKRQVIQAKGKALINKIKV